MDATIYQREAARTKSDMFHAPCRSGAHVNAYPGAAAHGIEVDVLHAALGLSTEAGEILGVAKKAMFYGKAVDYVNLDEEMGDALWYVAIYCNARGIALSDLMAQNVAKLQTWFPHCFTEEAANVRDLPAERQVLERHSTLAAGEANAYRHDGGSLP